MKPLKLLTLILFISAFAIIANAQNAEILAIANGKNYTVNDLDHRTRELYAGLDKLLADERTEILGEQISNILFKEEANSRKITVDSLLEIEVGKRISEPTEPEIKAVYDANKESIGNATLAQVRPQIVNFLNRQAYPKALEKYVGELKQKYKVVIGKDVNSPNLAESDVLATVNSKTITVQHFNEKAGAKLYQIRNIVYETAYNYLETNIFNEMVEIEAKKLNVSSSDLIAREVTDKMKDFSDEEREKLNNDFQNKIAQKYNVKFLLKKPIPFAQKISAGDSPSQGNINAPVTIVMFSDFQCPACGASHPILKQVMAEYGDKIRFVVRNFPLKMHKDAFNAAKAAQAAHIQGKFFEYIELLYTNQNSLDTTSLKRFAAQVGLNQNQFDADLESEKFVAQIEKDLADGNEYGVEGTPTIFVNGVAVQSLSAKSFREAIEWALKNKQ